MVLAELGSKIQAALSRLNQTTIVDEEVFNLILKEICGALLESDVNVKLVMTLRNAVKAAVSLENTPAGSNRRRLIQRAVMTELTAMLQPRNNTAYTMKKGATNVIMFVGLQGSGKTTTIAKFAHYYQRKGWKTCMVCADTFRAGAFDQLKQNATKLRIPFYGSYTEADPVRIAEDGVTQFRKEKYEIIIVDTSGRHKQESDLFDEMQDVARVVSPDDVVFVMDSSIGQAVSEQAMAFRDAVSVGSVIITKLDGHAKGGGALSAVSATNSPITFYGTGEHFTDFSIFDASSFVSRLLGCGDMKGLMEEVKDAGMLENQEAMVERLSQGVFTYRDMYDQFKNLMKLGPLSKVVGMMPGMGALMKGATMNDADGSEKLKKFIYLMDSMTNAELDGEVVLSESRRGRISKGAGVPIAEMDMLVQAHKQFATTVGRLGKSGLMGGQKNNPLLDNMSRNPAAAMQQLSKVMDPAMMAQMGGAQGMMKMMQQFQAGGASGPGGFPSGFPSMMS